MPPCSIRGAPHLSLTGSVFLPRMEAWVWWSSFGVGGVRKTWWQKPLFALLNRSIWVTGFVMNPTPLILLSPQLPHYFHPPVPGRAELQKTTCALHHVLLNFGSATRVSANSPGGSCGSDSSAGCVQEQNSWKSGKKERKRGQPMP